MNRLVRWGQQTIALHVSSNFFLNVVCPFISHWRTNFYFVYYFAASANEHVRPVTDSQVFAAVKAHDAIVGTTQLNGLYSFLVLFLQLRYSHHETPRVPSRRVHLCSRIQSQTAETIGPSTSPHFWTPSYLQTTNHLHSRALKWSSSTPKTNALLSQIQTTSYIITIPRIQVFTRESIKLPAD